MIMLPKGALKIQNEEKMERLLIKIAWLLPKKLVMWCGYRIGAFATTGKYEETIVPELTFMDAMERWK